MLILSRMIVYPVRNAKSVLMNKTRWGTILRMLECGFHASCSHISYCSDCTAPVLIKNQALLIYCVNFELICVT